jgi:hypothetical protein
MNSLALDILNYLNFFLISTCNSLFAAKEIILPAVFRIRIGFMRIRIQHFC